MNEKLKDVFSDIENIGKLKNLEIEKFKKFRKLKKTIKNKNKK